MISSIVAKIQSFRTDLFYLFKFRADSTMDLIDAIAGTTNESVVKASLSPLFRRKYSSITDVTDNLFRLKSEENPDVQELRKRQFEISKLLAKHCPAPGERRFTLLATDCTAKPRIYASKVSDRTIVHAPNHVPGQKPITVGHEYSLVVYLPEWENVLMRGNKLQQMEKYPFDVVQVQVFDEFSQKVFKNSLWLMVAGRRRGELKLEQVYESYAQRYDIEHCFRFGKQKLLLDRSQTPDTRHEENLVWVTMLSFAMLYQTRQLAVEMKYPWERYKVRDCETITWSFGWLRPLICR